MVIGKYSIEKLKYFLHIYERLKCFFGILSSRIGYNHFKLYNHCIKHLGICPVR
jgi:hypothetical protein